MGLWRHNMTLTPSPLARVPRQLGRSPVPRLLRSRQHAWLSLFVAFCRLCDKTTDFSKKRKRIAALAEVEGRGATGLCSSCPNLLRERFCQPLFGRKICCFRRRKTQFVPLR